MPAHRVNQVDAFRFALWARDLGRDVTVRDVEGLFGIHRTAAYRLVRNWQRALQTLDRFEQDTLERAS
jgi:hypothetical protein